MELEGHPVYLKWACSCRSTQSARPAPLQASRSPAPRRSATTPLCHIPAAFNAAPPLADPREGVKKRGRVKTKGQHRRLSLPDDRPAGHYCNASAHRVSRATCARKDDQRRREAHRVLCSQRGHRFARRDGRRARACSPQRQPFCCPVSPRCLKQLPFCPSPLLSRLPVNGPCLHLCGL